MSLQFTCPDCGGHLLEQLQRVTAIYSVDVTGADPDDFDIAYGHFQGHEDDEPEHLHYRCRECRTTFDTSANVEVHCRPGAGEEAQ